MISNKCTQSNGIALLQQQRKVVNGVQSEHAFTSTRVREVHEYASHLADELEEIQDQLISVGLVEEGSELEQGMWGWRGKF